MIKFKDIRRIGKAGEVVFDKRINRIPVKIIKIDDTYAAYVDGDYLDHYKSLSQAKTSINTTIKELS